jgi:hypothetical protein
MSTKRWAWPIRVFVLVRFLLVGIGSYVKETILSIGRLCLS